MDFFDQHKALIITVLLFSVIFLGMYNIRVSNKNDEMKEMLVQLQNYDFEELAKKEKTEQPKPKTEPSRQTQIKTHHAYNQNTEEREEQFQSRLDDIFKENSAKTEASEESASQGELAINTNKNEKPEQASQGNNTSEETSIKKGVMRNSSISFNLVGREAINIPNPIYTCDEAGKIVVNITVDAQGKVTSATINQASSNTTNQCLADQAMQYAAQAQFTELAGRNNQLGSITYNFQD